MHVAWLAPEEFPRFLPLSQEALRFFTAWSPVLSTSSNFIRLHLCQSLADLGLVIARGRDVESHRLFDQGCSILNPQD